ncbi:MAG: AAA family ATPase [Synechococcales cyanobacterium RM1_1_8]|nr:AAA family ATPase [Synechococcales cyanobacterium RM1_1_8]
MSYAHRPPPASGKTTFAHQRLKEDPNLTWVSSDRIRYQLYGNEATQGHWPTIEATALDQIRQAIAQGQSILYDATNAKLQWRKDFLAKAAPLTTAQGIPWLAWVLLPPVEICLQRNQQRGRKVPDAAIALSHASITPQPPTPAEGFLAIHILTD